MADRDDRVGGEVRRPLHPGGEPVAAAELVGLPRPARLEGVRGDDVRHAVHERGEQPGGVGVPGVASARGRCRRARRRSRRRRRRPAARRWRPAGWPGRRGRSRRRARPPKQWTSISGPGRQRAHRRHEVLDVHPRAAVDVRRPLPRHDPDAHGVTLGGGTVRAGRANGPVHRLRCVTCVAVLGFSASSWRAVRASGSPPSPTTAPSRRCRSAATTGSSTSCCPTWSTPRSGRSPS